MDSATGPHKAAVMVRDYAGQRICIETVIFWYLPFLASFINHCNSAYRIQKYSCPYSPFSTRYSIDITNILTDFC